jgi:hypothetical protein
MLVLLHKMRSCHCQLGCKIHFPLLQEDPNQWVWEPLALIAYLLFFRALVYIALRKRTKASVR